MGLNAWSPRKNIHSSSIEKQLTQFLPKCRTLARNNLTNIEPGTFKDLKKLKTLNLSFNNLRKWKVNPKDELQSLSNIDVTGNKAWLPSQQLLQLKNLTTVRGVTWTKYCGNCLLTRSHDNKTGLNSSCSRYKELSSTGAWPWHEQIQYGRALDFIKAGFWPTCLCDDDCYIHQFRLPNHREFYKVSLNGAFALYATGPLAPLANMAVVLVILLSKSLRSDTAAILICNVAVCDIFIGIVVITHAAAGRKLLGHVEVIEKRGDYYRQYLQLINVVGPTLISAGISHICGSFVMVLEKFLKIVYAMKPDIRLTRRSILLSLIMSWSTAVTIAVVPVFGVVDMVYNDYIPSDPHGVVLAIFALLTLIQCISLALYFPILTVAKRSAANVGIRRETTIAKKIALLVLTNLMFFTCPVVIGALRVRYTPSSMYEMTLSEAQWILFAFNALPLLCLSINSVLDPFLYAFRHPKVKTELTAVYIRCKTICNGSFTFIVQHCCSVRN